MIRTPMIRTPMIRTLTFLALLASPALAQQPPPASQPVRQINFNTGDTIDGQTQSPDEVLETARRRTPPSSLIRVRTDFNRKLLQTAETL